MNKLKLNIIVRCKAYYFLFCLVTLITISQMGSSVIGNTTLFPKNEAVLRLVTSII